MKHQDHHHQQQQQQQHHRGGGDGGGVRQRVNHCLTKLSDRDTESMAASELDGIALSLSPDALPSFVSAISDSRPTDKTPLRRHPLRLLSLLLSSHHPPSALLPLLPRMLSAALRRLRDPDSSVRLALIDAVRSIAAAAPPSAVVSVVLNPLADALLHEQDLAAQAAAALSLAAAVDSCSSSPDLAHNLQRLLPRLVKLLRSNAFKAKPALISLLGSIPAAGGASAPALVGQLVPCLVDFLSSEDWAARKAAADALAQIALSEKDLLGGFKSTCIATFESRRFDKVKIVRDSMNRMLELWKDIPGIVQDDAKALPPSRSQSNSSPRETASDGRCPVASLSSSSVKSASPFVARKSRFSESRSPPPNPSPVPTSRKNTNPSRSNISSRPLPLFRKTDRRRSSDWKVEVSIPQTPPFADVCEEKPLESKGQEQGGNARSKPDAKRMLFEKNSEDKVSKLAGLRSASRVVPLKETGSSESTAGGDGASDELHGSHKDGDLTMIRMQLVQIENQQSSLLDLLQRFIGSSQNGIYSLETRVHGLEIALDEISHDLAASYGRVSNNDPAAMTCCRLPGTEFLTSKFWRRTEGRYSSRFSVSGDPTLADTHILAGKQGQQSHKWDKQGFGLPGGFVVNPLAEFNSQSRGNTAEVTPSKMLKSVASYTGTKHTQDG